MHWPYSTARMLLPQRVSWCIVVCEQVVTRGVGGACRTWTCHRPDACSSARPTSGHLPRSPPQASLPTCPSLPYKPVPPYPTNLSLPPYKPVPHSPMSLSTNAALRRHIRHAVLLRQRVAAPLAGMA
eukprot:483952-Rhodomonas_salina.3